MPASQSQRLSCQTSPQLQLAVRHASSAENTHRRRDSRRSTLRSRQSRSGTPGSLSSRPSPWKCPCSADNLPECVPVVPTVSLQRDLVFFDLLRSLERSLTRDPHSSNELLYDARHRSQNLTPLAPTRQHAVLHPSDRCTPQMLDVGASPAVGYPACSPSPAVSSRFPGASG